MWLFDQDFGLDLEEGCPESGPKKDPTWWPSTRESGPKKDPTLKRKTIVKLERILFPLTIV